MTYKRIQSSLQELRMMADQNKVFYSFIGMGYYDCITPTVIQRQMLENAGWLMVNTKQESSFHL